MNTDRKDKSNCEHSINHNKNVRKGNDFGIFGKARRR